jgi:hypothetical protein
MSWGEVLGFCFGKSWDGIADRAKALPGESGVIMVRGEGVALPSE